MDYRRLRRTWTNKLGAEVETDSDHIYYFMRINGISHRIGKVSHSCRGADDVLDYVITDTARRMKVTKPELNEIVNCTKSKAEYIRIWEERYNR